MSVIIFFLFLQGPLPVPDVIVGGRDAKAPLWISADSAFAGAVGGKGAHRGTDRVEEVKALMRRGPKVGRACVEMETLLYGIGASIPDWASFDILAQEQAEFVVGTVSAIKPGFYGDTDYLPLVEVSVPVDDGAQHKLYLMYPSTDSEYAGTPICRRDPRYAHTARVGERVLVLLRSGSLDPSTEVHYVRPADVFFAQPGGYLAEDNVGVDRLPAGTRRVEDLARVLGDAGVLERTLR